MLGEIFRLFGTIGINNKEANDGIDKTTSKAEGAGSKIAGFFKKAAIAIGGFFAAKKLIDFGKLAIEAAAGVQALQAQFEQVFTDLQSDATKAINDMAKEFGMVPNRLKPGMTKMTSMFKGLGMDTEEAMGKATDAVRLSADAAAFYDVSFESANQSLTSFLKGNYEAGEAIGIFANDTQMAQFAIQKGIVSSTGEWQKLDEATKQATRLEYAANMQELAGATGQAARESDGYENQVGNLKQAWQDFLAIVGGPILAPVVGGLKIVSGWLVIAGKKVQELQTWFGNALDRFKQTEAWEIITDAVQLVVDKFNEFKSNFSNIKDAVLNSGVIDTIKDYITNIVDFWTGLFSGEGNLGQTFVRIFKMVKDVAMPILEDAIKFAKGIIKQVTDFWNENGEQIVQAVKNAFEFIANIIKFFMPLVEGIIATVWGNIKGVIQGALNIILGLIKIFTGIFSGDWSKVWEGIKQTLKGALEFAWNLINLILFKNMLGGIKSFVSNGIANIKNFFTGIVEGAKTGLSSFSNLWNGAVNFVKSIITGFKDNAVGIFNSLKSSVTNIFNGIKTAIQNPIQTAANFVKTMIDKIKGFFNFTWKLPKLSLPHFSINPSGWKIGDLLKGSIPKLGIDWYAKGGIMTDPTIFGFNGRNAMVGGEAGAEAIAPIDTLLDYVRTAVSESNAGLAEILLKILAELRETNNTLFETIVNALINGTRIEWNDRELARLVKKYA